MEENLEKEILQRLTKDLLDIQVLRIINAEPAWGYKIKKQIETTSDLKIRHSILYPTLNKLEKQGLITSQKSQKGRRIRKVYTITEKGKAYLKAYQNIIKQQVN